MRSKARAAAIFGASDGLVACIGVVLATAARGQASVLHAVVGLLIAEGLGMAAADWLSDDSDTNWRQALVMGTATSAPIVLVALPWLVLTGNPGTAGSCAVALVVAGAVAWARRGRWRGWAETYGVLAGVAGLAWIAGGL